MNNGELFSVILLGCAIFFFISLSFKYSRSGCSVKSYLKILWPVLFCILLFVFFFEPNSAFRWDLIEHYNIIDEMTQMGFVRALCEGRYKNLVIVNFYFALVSLLPNYHILPVIPLMIDFLIFTNILKDVAKNKALTYGKMAFITLVYLGTMGLMLAISGIRCVLAVSIAVAGMYLEITSKQHRKLSYILYLVALFIHYFAFIIVIIRFLSSFKSKIIVTFSFAAFLTFGINILSGLLRSISSSYLFEGINTFLYEYRLFVTWDYFPKLTLFGRLNCLNQVLIICYLYYVCKNVEHNQILNKTETNILSFSKSVAIIGFIFYANFLLLQRLMYIVAFCFVMMLPMYFQRQSKQSNIINICFGLLISWVLFFCELYPFIANYVGYWFLTRG